MGFYDLDKEQRDILVAKIGKHVADDIQQEKNVHLLRSRETDGRQHSNCRPGGGYGRYIAR